MISNRCGGRGGIRTHEGLTPLAVFKTAALNHSATLPHLISLALLAPADHLNGSPATALLPFVLGALPCLPLQYGVLQNIVDARYRVGLHVRHQVGVDVHGYGYARMAEPLLHDLGMDV